jgi:tRNA(Ile2) C34 agmatinyltransferase TiaS
LNGRTGRRLPPRQRDTERAHFPYCRVMAKTIRPLLCPQCGSPDKTTFGPDQFRCNACQTEYYLDTDDVTVTVRHQHTGLPHQSQVLR